MGKYYGIINESKRHKISSYWKGLPPTIEELKEIIKEFKWDKEDKIIASSYEDSYIYKEEKWVENEEEIKDEGMYKETGIKEDIKFNKIYFNN